MTVEIIIVARSNLIKPKIPPDKVGSNLDHISYLSPTRIVMDILYAPNKVHIKPKIEMLTEYCSLSLNTRKIDKIPKILARKIHNNSDF